MVYEKMKEVLVYNLVDVIWVVNDDIVFGVMWVVCEFGLILGKDIVCVGMNWFFVGMEVVCW